MHRLRLAAVTLHWQLARVTCRVGHRGTSSPDAPRKYSEVYGHAVKRRWVRTTHINTSTSTIVDTNVLDDEKSGRQQMTSASSEQPTVPISVSASLLAQ